MSEPVDKVTEGFRALRAATAAGVSPPGVAAVKRTVQRRRTTRASLALLLVALAVPLGWQASRTAMPTTPATPSADATTSASPMPTPTSSTTATVEVGPGGTGEPQPNGTTPAPVCNPHVFGDGSKMWIADDAAWNSAACVGKTIGVFWVTYRTVEGNKVKYRSGQYSLGAGSLEVAYSPAVPPELCGFSQFAVRGGSVPDLLPGPLTDYDSASIYWNSRGQQMLWHLISSPCAGPTP